MHRTPPFPSLRRRQLLSAAAAAALTTAVPARAQPGPAPRESTALEVVQIIDSSNAQLDVSRDFLIGSRAAWQEVNRQGGVRGRPVQHTVIEVDGSPPSLRQALETVRASPRCVALSGTAGDRAAAGLVQLLQQSDLAIAHVAPWLHDDRSDAAGHTYTIFASRQTQIRHALTSLSVVGVAEIGAVYASEREQALYGEDVRRAAHSLQLRLVDYAPRPSLARLSHALTAASPPILLFIGGTPELAQFATGLAQQDRQRYVIGLADINLQTMLQTGLARTTPVIAAQVVPVPTASLPIVRSYRATLAQLFDEAPTSLSLSGYIAARYTHAVLQATDGAPSRARVLEVLQQRAAMDLGGFRIDAPAGGASAGRYVTLSMLTADGRILG